MGPAEQEIAAPNRADTTIGEDGETQRQFGCGCKPALPHSIPATAPEALHGDRADTKKLIGDPSVHERARISSKILRRNMSRCANSGPEQMQQTYRGLLYHLVGGRDKIRRERKLERMGSTKIDNEIKFRRYVDRKIAGVSAAKDAINVAGG